MQLYSNMPSVGKKQGFSVLELMVSVAIAGITLTMGVPAMNETLTEQRVNAAVKHLAKDLTYARTYAVTNNSIVTICPLTGSNCTTNWQEGYTIFIDGDASGTFDSINDLKLVINEDFDFGELKLTSNDNKLQYKMNGAIDNQVSFIYCPYIESSYAKGVTISSMGRAKITADYDGDGIDELSVSNGASDINCL